MKKRNLVGMIALMFITFGLYIPYWFVVTKAELNARGAKIPTALLFIIPFGNFYFLYKFAEAFCVDALKDKQDTTILLYFILITFFMPIGIIICKTALIIYSYSLLRILSIISAGMSMPVDVKKAFCKRAIRFS